MFGVLGWGLSWGGLCGRVRVGGLCFVWFIG